MALFVTGLGSELEPKVTTIALPDGSSTGLTLVTRTALPDFSSAPVWLARTLATEGSVVCDSTAMCKRLYLSLKATSCEASRRAHPSGTLMLKPKGDR